MSVRELDLDLDAFEGPFDLLLTLVLREELPLAEVDVAGIVLAFVERLAEREELDLDACGEFLVLVAALLELKARALFAGEGDLEDLEPSEAAEELARRLEEYRRIKGAAEWLGDRLAAERDRFFRLGPAPLARSGSGASPSRIRRRSSSCCTLWRPSRRSLSGSSRAPLPTGFAVPGAVPGAARPPKPVRLRPGGRRAVAGRAGRCVPRAARAAPCRRDLARAGGAVRADPCVPFRSAQEEVARWSARSA